MCEHLQSRFHQERLTSITQALNSELTKPNTSLSFFSLFWLRTSKKRENSQLITSDQTLRILKEASYLPLK